VTALSPSSGSTAAGTTVQITGKNFIGVSAMAFGASPAASFTVDSPTQITATSPPGTAGPVDLTVTALGGTSPTSGADQFSYHGPASSTSTSVVSSANSAVFGQSVTFTATVTDTAGSAAPTGAVQFLVDDANFGAPVPLTPGSGASTAQSSATASLSIAGSPHAVVAQYLGSDGNFAYSTASLSQVIAPPIPSAALVIGARGRKVTSM
jgi:Bacterial Ig-like domain (group 3)/IPT/TIG domain